MSDDPAVAALSQSRLYIGREMLLDGRDASASHQRRSEFVIVEAIDFVSPANNAPGQRRGYAVVTDSGEVALRAAEIGDAAWILGAVWGYPLVVTNAEAQPCFSLRCSRLLRSRAAVRSNSGAPMGEVISTGRRSGYRLCDATRSVLAEVQGADIGVGALEIVGRGRVMAKVSRGAEPSSGARDHAPAAVTRVDFSDDAPALVRVLTLATVLLVAFDHADTRWR